MQKDLTLGKPSHVLWKFCIPLLGSVVFQQLYNIADSFVAGKFISSDALAAVGNGYEIILIFLAFGVGSNIGCSVVTAKLFGAKRIRDLKTGVCTAYITGGVLCALLLLFGMLFGRPLLMLIHTPENIFADSLLYLRIYTLGFPFLFFYNVSNGIFSAMGDSRTPFLFLAASSVSNIGMDILFVAGFRMGVAGVAWATFLCQGVSCVLAVYVVLKRLRSMETEGRTPLFSFAILGEIAAVAIPSILQQSFVSVGNIIIQSVINTFGSGVIAGYAAAVKLNNMAISVLMAMCNGVSNYTAQNLGAKKYDRIRDGRKASLMMVWSLAIPFTLCFFCFAGFLCRLFLDTDSAEAMAAGTAFLHIVSPFYAVVAAKLASDSILRGCGRMRAFMVSTFTDLTLRVVLSILFAKTLLGSTGIWMSWPFGWIAATVISVTFLSGMLKHLGEKTEQDA